MNRRRIAGVLCMLSVLLLISLVSWYFVAVIEEGEKTRESSRREQEKVSFRKERAETYTERIAASSTVPALENTLAKMKEYAASFTDEDRKLFSSLIMARIFEARARERDNLLFFAGRLLEADKNDPLGLEYLENAKKLHEENMRAIDAILPRAGDCEWNARLWYRKGVEYYRSLVFLESGMSSRAADLVAQAIENFEKVFSCIPKDRNTEVALEILYRRSRDAEGSSVDDPNRMRKKLELLPQEEVGPPRGWTPESREEGRH